MPETWEVLTAKLERARRWPVPDEEAIRRRVNMWAALRESDEQWLRVLHKWERDRLYVIDPLPEKIADAYGNLLFGQDPTFAPANTADQELMDELVDANTLPSQLQTAESLCVSEGEVWWRIFVPAAAMHPLIDFRTRADVVPLLHGRTPVAVAFVSRLMSPGGSQDRTVWRHIELQSRGRVENLLYRGRENALGSRRELGSHPETVDLIELWEHGLPMMLAGRIVNRFGRRPQVGTSIYSGIWPQFLVLNEATSIGRENMKLTAKKRVVVPPGAVRPRNPQEDFEAGEDRGDGSIDRRPRAAFDSSEDVLIADQLDVTEGRGENAPFRVLEYSFDAEALIAYKRDVAETILNRCDIVPQFSGQGDFGWGASGTALRVRLLPTLNASEGRARAWDDELPRIVEGMVRVEALPISQLGLANSAWTEPDARPTVTRNSSLPEDPAEEASRHATLRTSDLISIETSLRERYPERDDQWITQEVERIRGDVQAMAPAATFGSGG
jgi:hypothetical protein